MRSGESKTQLCAVVASGPLMETQIGRRHSRGAPKMRTKDCERRPPAEGNARNKGWIRKERRDEDRMVCG